MKVALCFAGHMRDLNETKNFWTELIKKYDIDVYASFWDIENSELGDTIKEFEKVYSPKRLEVESYDVFKSTTQDIASMHIQSPTSINQLFQHTSKAFGQLSMYYKVWRANMLSKQLGIELNEQLIKDKNIIYDIIHPDDRDIIFKNIYKSANF
jgi:hypothetical protein